MERANIRIPETIATPLWAHLLGHPENHEEAAFLFSIVERCDPRLDLNVFDWEAIREDDYRHRGIAGIEITDECRARIIKRAHDLGSSLIEVHSHPFPFQAVFSEIDLDGLAEWVPHVRWRLKGRPYAAMVVAPDSVDALVWADLSQRPRGVNEVLLGTRVMRPTGLTMRFLEADDVISL